jgi:gluconate 5-dehydrogenase
MHPLFDLTGRIALVTGSSRGIGLALARALASAGARVAINGRDAGAVEGVVAGLRTEGIDASAATFDVTDEAAVEAAVDEIERDLAPIGIHVNNHMTAMNQFSK